MREPVGKGTFIAVVGPSGSGKDTLIRAALARRPGLVAARRVISRDGHDPTEDFDSVTPAAFARMRLEGAFALHWHAHGLDYGIPASVEADLDCGQHVLANLSRDVLVAARARFDPFLAVTVTAPPQVLAARLGARGREDPGAIRERLERAGHCAGAGETTVVHNGGDLEDAVRAFLAALPPPQPVSA